MKQNHILIARTATLPWLFHIRMPHSLNFLDVSEMHQTDDRWTHSPSLASCRDGIFLWLACPWPALLIRLPNSIIHKNGFFCDHESGQQGDITYYSSLSLPKNQTCDGSKVESQRFWCLITEAWWNQCTSRGVHLCLQSTMFALEVSFMKETQTACLGNAYATTEKKKCALALPEKCKCKKATSMAFAHSIQSGSRTRCTVAS